MIGDVACRDDCGRLALHWSAELGLAEVCQLLLQATTEAAAALTARVAAAAADAETGEEQPMLEMPNLLEMQVGAAEQCNMRLHYVTSAAGSTEQHLDAEQDAE